MPSAGIVSISKSILVAPLSRGFAVIIDQLAVGQSGQRTEGQADKAQERKWNRFMKKIN
jgi:hypothetical protein